MAREIGLAKKEAQSLIQSARPAVAPACDIYENGDEVLLIADLPGVATDALTLNFENGELALEAHRELPTKGTFVTSEVRDCDFRRRFAVPIGIDGGKVSAELKDGVLRLHMPKAEGLRPRQIAVKAG